MFDGYVTPDGELVCEICADGDELDPLYGESDSPDHCAYCGRPLDHGLTQDGVRYILARIEEEIAALLKKSKRERQAPGGWPAGHYYHGSPGYAVVADWADRLDGWSLSPHDKSRIAFFRGLCKPPRAA